VSTVLVTGGAGFIGSHLCDRLLAEGRRVVALDDLSSGNIGNLAEARGYGQQFTFYNLDVNTEGLGLIFERHQPEVVMHLGAPRGTEVRLDAPGDARVGIMGLLAVLRCAAASGVRKCVFASSHEAYGEARRFPIRETAMGGARPLTPTGVSKKAAEDYLRFFHGSRGLAFTSVILPTVYGPRQDDGHAGGVVARFASALLSGRKPVVYGDGNQTRDFLFVDDAVHAFALAADRGDGATVNVGTGIETSVLRIFEMLAEITGFAGEALYEAPPLAEVRRSALDNEQAERELGWKPWTHLEDGLREAVSYLRHG
jgi:UDP-glucose 4-epimerase